MVKMGHRPKLWLGVFFAALGFRVALFFSKLVDVVFFTNDSPQYTSMAESLVHHHVFGVDGVPQMTRTPGYPAFLALLYGLIGRHSQLLITSVQVVIDSMVCCLVVDLAVRMRLSRPAWLATAVLAVTCLYTSTFAFQIMTETLYTLAITAAVWVLPLQDGTVDFFRDWKRPLACGALLGFAVLVRPGVFPAALMFLGLILIQARGFGLRGLTRKVAVGPLALVLGLTAFVAPWMLRNYLQFPSAYDGSPDRQDHVTLLGQWAPSPYYRHIFTPQFKAWRGSCEEPLVMTRTDTAPILMRTVYPMESVDVGRAFVQLKSEMDRGDQPITRPTLDVFAQMAARRYRAAPRLYVTAPVSRILKLWLTPRISGLFLNHSGADSSHRLTVGLTLYNSLYVIPGLAGLFLGWRRRATCGWTLAVALVVWQTLLNSVFFADTTSRYAVPLFPLLCVGFGVTVERALRRWPKAAGEPSRLSPA